MTHGQTFPIFAVGSLKSPINILKKNIIYLEIAHTHSKSCELKPSKFYQKIVYLTESHSQTQNSYYSNNIKSPQE